MSLFPPYAQQCRRDFLTSSTSGIGLLALASLFRDDGLLAEEAKSCFDAWLASPIKIPY